MKIEIGRTYQVRSLIIVKELGLKTEIRITRMSPSGLYVGDDLCYYNEDGTCHAGIDKYDLVKDVTNFI